MVREEGSPVFIVGIPRSGTTLLASMLAGHPSFDIGPETQFFSQINSVRLRACVRDSRWPSRAVDEISRLTLAGQSVIELYGHTGESIAARLAARRPSVSAMLEELLLPEPHMRRNRWAEKTPDHLSHLDEIFKAFPGARVIMITRDPRDVSRSLLGMPWASQRITTNAWTWQERNSRSAPARHRYEDRIIQVKYEDLLLEPFGSLRRICDFLGESFHPSMLETDKFGASVSSPNEAWKSKNAKKIDPSRAYSWKSVNGSREQRAVELICAEGIREFDYELESWPKGFVAVLSPIGSDVVDSIIPIILSENREDWGIQMVSNPLERGTVIIPSFGFASRIGFRLALYHIAVKAVRRIVRLSTRIVHTK